MKELAQETIAFFLFHLPNEQCVEKIYQYLIIPSNNMQPIVLIREEDKK
jgi:3-hydroxy-3-methylglutaryl CoA synthase